jgi:hypothetical protein
MILRGDPAWRDRFRFTAAGLATALAIFIFVAFLAVAFASMSIGMPSLPGVAAAIIVMALPLLALLATLITTRNLLRSDQPLLPILVPATYAVTAFLLIEGTLALIGGPVVMLAWLALGYLLAMLVRRATGWNYGVAVSFAVLTVLLLVATRIGLYMLSAPPGSPI